MDTTTIQINVYYIYASPAYKYTYTAKYKLYFYKQLPCSVMQWMMKSRQIGRISCKYLLSGSDVCIYQLYVLDGTDIASFM